MRGFSKRVPVASAHQWIHSLPLNPKTELVGLGEANGRVLAKNITSDVDVPGFRRSMMDGFAVKAEDVVGASSYNPIELKIVGEVYPGQACCDDIQPQESIQVMTGAEMPQSANAVVPVEYAERNDNSVHILAPVAEEKNVGQVGEDIGRGNTVLQTGRKLRPQDVALLSSIGVPQVEVIKRPIVSILVTGNELLAAGQKPQGVQIVDSNSVMLSALIRRDGGVPEFPGILPDDPDVILEAIESPADVILVAGGSSTGKEDHAPGLVRQRGELDIHGIAMRPSSPAGMGLIDSTPVFLLPGNPVSCLCAYDFFAREVIQRLSGQPAEWPYRKISLPLRQKISSQIGRTDYARVRIVDEMIEPIAISGASILSSTIEADGFAIIAEESEGLAPGSMLDVYLY